MGAVRTHGKVLSAFLPSSGARIQFAWYVPDKLWGEPNILACFDRNTDLRMTETVVEQQFDG